MHFSILRVNHSGFRISFGQTRSMMWDALSDLVLFVQAWAGNFPKSSTPPWVFFTFLKLYKRHQIAKSISIMKIEPVKQLWWKFLWKYPAGICMFKVNNRNTRTRCEICSELIIKTSERRHWRLSGLFIVNFEHISHLVLVFFLLTLSR